MKDNNNAIKANISLLFIGGFFQDELLNEIETNSKGSVQYAANELQQHLIIGFSQVFPGEISLLTEPFIGSFPKHYKKLIVKRYNSIFLENISCSQRSFCNLTGLNIVSRFYAFKEGVFDWINQNQGKSLYIVIYSIQIYYLWLAKCVKDAFPSVHIHIIIPDLPNYMSLGAKKMSLRNVAKQYRIILCKKNIKCFDSFTLLSAHMADYLQLDESSYVVVEGIAKESYGKRIDTNKESSIIKTVLYTGTLTKKYGVLDLVEAFRAIPKENYRLIICGDGETKKEIENASKEDARIIYMGRVNHEAVLNLQAHATILVNPRKNTGSYTKYSFPSKMMEYLASGRPVLCYKLDGFPEEYDTYFNYIQGNEVHSFTESIQEICEKSNEELNKEGDRNRHFVNNNKNPRTQVSKIVDLLLS